MRPFRQGNKRVGAWSLFRNYLRKPPHIFCWKKPQFDNLGCSLSEFLTQRPGISRPGAPCLFKLLININKYYSAQILLGNFQENVN